VSDAPRKLESCRAAAAAADADIERKDLALARWRTHHGLDPAGSADDALEAIGLLAEVRTQLQEINRRDSDAVAVASDVARFVEETWQLSGACGRAAAVATTRGTSESIGRQAVETANRQLTSLMHSLDEAEERSQRRLGLESELESCAESLTNVLGGGERGGRLLVELAVGEVPTWSEESEELNRLVEELEADEEAAVRRHESSSTELQELATSDRIATLEQREAELDAELQAVLRQYLVFGTARSLLQRTVARHERERQPAVIANAAAHFRRVTAGRYVNLIADPDSEGRQSIRVVSSSGQEIDAASLSRGTVEQLYLCLRLALAESFAERSIGLPMVLDDVLVNFDPERAEAMAMELALTARHRQILLMTCHPRLAELALRTASEGQAPSQLIELDRIA
jgi:uncharacterized protein YhaN